MKDFIKKRLNETLNLQEKESSGGGSSKYDNIKAMLDSPFINNAAVIDELWEQGDSEDAGKRSLFGKKLNRDTNSEGGTYEFNEEELSKIASILMSLSSKIRKTVGKAGNV
jgi:hypothetical protein